MRSADDARGERLEQVNDHYEARQQALERKAFGAPPYNPVPPESLLSHRADWQAALRGRQRVVLDPFEHPRRRATQRRLLRRQAGARPSPPSAQREGGNVFDAVVAHAERLQGEGKRVLVACWSKGAKERLGTLLAEHGIGDTLRVETWQRCWRRRNRPHLRRAAARDRLRGATSFAVIGEQDILGDRLVRRAQRQARGSDVLTEASSLAAGRSRRPCRSRHRALRRACKTIEVAGRAA